MIAERNIEAAIAKAKKDRSPVELAGSGVAVVALDVLEDILEALEDAQDIAALEDYAERKTRGGVETIPAHIVHAIR